MGRKKLKNPYVIGNPARRALIEESSLALSEYNARKQTRIALAENEEIINNIEVRDSYQEVWMWGIMALVLHRRYKWTAKTITTILQQVQDLHNEMYDGSQEWKTMERKINALVWEEVGIKIHDDNMGVTE